MQIEQPQGFWSLFLVKFLERFAHYGVRALFVIYLVKILLLSTKQTATIYGWYLGLMYFIPILGGFLADKIFGAKKAVLIGFILMVAGYFALTIKFLPVFYFALILIILGMGFFTPNFLITLGTIYKRQEIFRESGFTLLILATSLGAFTGALFCGFVGEKFGFSYGFAVAGFAMIAGFLIYRNSSKKYLREENYKIKENIENKTKPTNLKIIFLLIFFALLFSIISEQTEMSANLFSSNIDFNYILSISGFLTLILIPLFAKLWVILARKNKNPSILAKFGLGFISLGLGFLIILIGTTLVSSLNIPWFITGYLLFSLAELLIYPIGVSAITRYAPQSYASTLMGLWLFIIFLGSFSAGFVSAETYSVKLLLLLFAIITGICAVVLLFISKKLNKNK